jgi:hypothetical protein
MCTRAEFLRCIGLSGFGFLFVSRGTAHAIPQNFNQGAFFLRTGVNFENFATDDAAFGEGASLKGEWSKPDAHGVQTLRDDAVVFGFPAKQITAERDGGRVKQFVVTFEETAPRARTPIVERVTQNVSAFTGESPRKRTDGARIFRQGHVQIDVRAEDARRVRAKFTAVP